MNPQRETRHLVVRQGVARQGSRRRGYHASIDPEGIVRVWDPLAKNWSTEHTLSKDQLRFVRENAR